MSEKLLQQSQNWDKYKDVMSRVEGDYFTEGFPRYWYKGDNYILFTVITCDGQRHTAYVDASTQYRDEGLNWTEYPSGEMIYRFNVIAWRELTD